jgi:hypothetical protein
MPREASVTAVQEALRSRWRVLTPIYFILLVVFLIGIIAGLLGIALLWQISRNRTPHYADIIQHFEYGSIGAEPESGIPYRIWRALPQLFPQEFQGRDDYTAFGFLYEADPKGKPSDLPIGIARREVRGVEVVWFNCATCHVGTVRERPDGPRRIVQGMPSNNLDLYRFIRFLLDAGADERLSPDRLIPAMAKSGGELGVLEKMVFRFYVIPRLREGLIQRRSRLLPLLARQPPWGPGKVDTFNPYKLIQANIPAGRLDPRELFGAADFPAIFLQGPREGMRLHWDGNNPSLAERNLSAALGAGVTPETVDHDAIERVADWLRDLRPPPSPYPVDPATAARGRQTYMRVCATCHGYQDQDGYVFVGERLGTVEPNGRLGADPGRLDSYTEELRAIQLAEFFRGTPYQFRHFVKTDGYANLPLDGLWLRAPYLHNGSVPTLADLLEAPERRPASFLRSIDIFDAERGGFVAPACDPVATPPAGAFCLDTRLPGNGNRGHLYGTDLPPSEKADLLAYLLTF